MNIKTADNIAQSGNPCKITGKWYKPTPTAVVKDVIAEVNAGSTVTDALAKHGTNFGELYQRLAISDELRALYKQAVASRGGASADAQLMIAKRLLDGDLDSRSGEVAARVLQWYASRADREQWGDAPSTSVHVGANGDRVSVAVVSYASLTPGSPGDDITASRRSSNVLDVTAVTAVTAVPAVPDAIDVTAVTGGQAERTSVDKCGKKVTENNGRKGKGRNKGTDGGGGITNSFREGGIVEVTPQICSSTAVKSVTPVSTRTFSDGPRMPVDPLKTVSEVLMPSVRKMASRGKSKR